MKCYLINLDRSVERLSFMMEQAKALGVDIERVRAVEVGEFPPTIAAPSLYPGEVACFLSHRKCWKLIAEGSDDFAVIFEDDAVLSTDATRFLTSTDWLPSTADIVKLETFGQRVFLRRRGAEKALNRKIRVLASWHAGTAGYVISKQMAQRLLGKSGSHIEYPVDYLLFDWELGGLRSRKVYQLDPAICIQSDRLELNDLGLAPTISRPAGGVPKRSKGNPTKCQKVWREFKRVFLRAKNFVSHRNLLVCERKRIEMSNDWFRIMR